MLGAILVFLVVLGVLGALVFTIPLITYECMERRTKQKYDYNQMTTTGETAGERKAYHDLGELSPGEHDLARQIRERLKERPIE